MIWRCHNYSGPAVGMQMEMTGTRGVKILIRSQNGARFELCTPYWQHWVIDVCASIKGNCEFSLVESRRIRIQPSTRRLTDRNRKFLVYSSHARPSTIHRPSFSRLDQLRSAGIHRLAEPCSIEEIRVYREHFKEKRLRFSNAQMRRMGVTAKALRWLHWSRPVPKLSRIFVFVVDKGI